MGKTLAMVGRFDTAMVWFRQAAIKNERGDEHGRVDHESLEISRRAFADVTKTLR